eukprot:CAMPEP_0174698736 /NCGR_PEP_ID=MMETSP1094-20130205/4242_1 /TAXON_ID=156173 /ORGANISM="Chrysochromulina brevifilum, Strain UTEX LB 985" /LENGTH=125 /DNA_ID=CAMNT_0015895959 /DNA_START=161 /DNA_END=538 /DNA_ORIENTATION=-
MLRERLGLDTSSPAPAPAPAPALALAPTSASKAKRSEAGSAGLLEEVLDQALEDRTICRNVLEACQRAAVSEPTLAAWLQEGKRDAANEALRAAGVTRLGNRVRILSAVEDRARRRQRTTIRAAA